MPAGTVSTGQNFLLPTINPANIKQKYIYPCNLRILACNSFRKEEACWQEYGKLSLLKLSATTEYPLKPEDLYTTVKINRQELSTRHIWEWEFFPCFPKTEKDTMPWQRVPGDRRKKSPFRFPERAIQTFYEVVLRDQILMVLHTLPCLKNPSYHRIFFKGMLAPALFLPNPAALNRVQLLCGFEITL